MKKITIVISALLSLEALYQTVEAFQKSNAILGIVCLFWAAIFAIYAIITLRRNGNDELDL